MSGRHKFSDLEAAMPPRRRARIETLAQTLSEQLDRDRALPMSAVLSLLRRHPRGLSRRRIMRELDVSDRHSIDQSLATLIERALVTVDRSGGPLGEVYRCTATVGAEDKLTAAGK